MPSNVKKRKVTRLSTEDNENELKNVDSKFKSLYPSEELAKIRKDIDDDSLLTDDDEDDQDQYTKTNTNKVHESCSKSSKQTSKRWPHICLYLIFAILAFCALYFEFTANAIPLVRDFLNSFYRNDKNIDQLLKKLMNDFEGKIPTIGNRIVNVSISNALDQNSIFPVVLLLIGSQQQESTLHHLSQQIGHMMVVSPPTIQLNNSHTAQHIVQFYDESFVTKGMPVLILENLEQLSPSVAMTFHQFADDENSRLPSTFVVMTLKYDDNNSRIQVDQNATLKQLSTISSQLLEDLWKSAYHRNDLDCLINRLAKYAIVLVNQ